MEILFSSTGKEYNINKVFAPEFIKVLISEDFGGERILPPNIKDDIYDIIIPYFNTGKIKIINDEIISALDFLGYEIPEYGFIEEAKFPEEYQLIWLEEYWVKINFDNLEDFGNSTLLLLDDVYDQILSNMYIDTDMLVSKEPSRKLSLDRLYGSLKEEIPKFAIAGGYIVGNLINGRYRDIDYFHISESIPNQDEAITDLKNAIKKFTDGEYYSVHRTKNSVTFNNIHQLILRSYRSIAEVVYGFDVDCCGIIYYKKKIYMTPRCLYSLKYMVNTVDMTKCSQSYETRLYKYYLRGYSIKIAGLKYKNININNIRNLENDRRLRNNFLYFYDKKRECMTVDAIENKYEFAGLDILLLMIFSKRRFRLSISDYDKSESNIINFEESKKELSPTRIDDNCCIYFFKNIIHYRVSDRQESILKYIIELDDEYYQNGQTKVNKKISFMTKSPGSQINGSFHKIIVNDYTKWFNGNFYNSVNKTFNVETRPTKEYIQNIANKISINEPISTNMIKLFKKYKYIVNEI